MKTTLTLVAGIVLGLLIALAYAHLVGPRGSEADFASLHSRFANTDSTRADEQAAPSAAMSLMQTDTALCEQPYFVEVYELSVDYFATGVDKANADEFAEIMFSHARDSGFFTAAEAEGWIEHIAAIPGQLVEIYREDPAVLDSCYSFQVAAVGPPA